MADLYAVLIKELKDNIDANMSEEEILTSLTEKNKVKVISRFGSFRTLANVLDDTEYATVKATLGVAAQSSAKLADMLVMLNLPGDEQGNGGGIDIGSPQVRAVVDALFSAEIAAKIKGYAEVLESRAEQLGITDIAPGHISSAKTLSVVAADVVVDPIEDPIEDPVVDPVVDPEPEPEPEPEPVVDPVVDPEVPVDPDPVVNPVVDPEVNP